MVVFDPSNINLLIDLGIEQLRIIMDVMDVPNLYIEDKADIKVHVSIYHVCYSNMGKKLNTSWKSLACHKCLLNFLF